MFSFETIVITADRQIDDEVKKIKLLFEHGLETIHIRKKELWEEDLKSFLSEFSLSERKKMVLHTFHNLAVDFNLKGIHLTEAHKSGIGWDKLKEYTQSFTKNSITVSASFHSVSDIRNTNMDLDYAFLSPVFDSISKPDLSNNNSKIMLDMKSFPERDFKIIALGGVSEKNMWELPDMGFDGAAVLGEIWYMAKPGKEHLKLEAILDKWQN